MAIAQPKSKQYKLNRAVQIVSDMKRLHSTNYRQG